MMTHGTYRSSYLVQIANYTWFGSRNKEVLHDCSLYVSKEPYIKESREKPVTNKGSSSFHIPVVAESESSKLRS